MFSPSPSVLSGPSLNDVMFVTLPILTRINLACKPGVVASMTKGDRLVSSNPWRNYFLFFALKVFLFVCFCFTLQCFIFFELSCSQNVKIRIIKRLVTKLGYKQGGKPATGTVRLGFRFGQGHQR